MQDVMNEVVGPLLVLLMMVVMIVVVPIAFTVSRIRIFRKQRAIECMLVALRQKGLSEVMLVLSTAKFFGDDFGFGPANESEKYVPNDKYLRKIKASIMAETIRSIIKYCLNNCHFDRDEVYRAFANALIGLKPSRRRAIVRAMDSQYDHEREIQQGLAAMITRIHQEADTEAHEEAAAALIQRGVNACKPRVKDEGEINFAKL